MKRKNMTKIMVMLSMMMICLSLSFNTLYSNAFSAQSVMSSTSLSTLGYVDMYVINLVDVSDVRWIINTPTNRTLVYTDVSYSHEFGSLKRIYLVDGTGWYTVQPEVQSNGVWYQLSTSYGFNSYLNLDRYLYPADEVESKGTTGWNQFFNTIPSASTTIATGHYTDLDKAQTFNSWVFDNVTYNMDESIAIANGTVDQLFPWHGAEYAYIWGQGVCHDKAALFAGLCRAQNIPCKVVVGYLGTNYHAWNEVYISGSWIKCDPTADRWDTQVDSSYNKTGDYYPAN